MMESLLSSELLKHFTEDIVASMKEECIWEHFISLLTEATDSIISTLSCELSAIKENAENASGFETVHSFEVPDEELYNILLKSAESLLKPKSLAIRNEMFPFLESIVEFTEADLRKIIKETLLHCVEVVPPLVALSDDIDDGAEDVENEDGSRVCEMCGATRRLTLHHLVPQLILKRNKKVGKNSEPELILICACCHKTLHKMFDHAYLGAHLNSRSKILEREELQAYLKWRRQNVLATGGVGSRH
eukprot:GCRY01001504.1.p1 GENE.GCRY01001504.1~~GCRY01001504.1.p1  ORF type:complete len:247 (-),score=16.70 GCRY01001504.1:123-863(-)